MRGYKYTVSLGFSAINSTDGKFLANDAIGVVFDKDLKQETVNINTIYIKNEAGAKIGQTYAYSQANKRVTITPAALEKGKTYTLVVTTGVESKEGNKLVSEYTKGIAVENSAYVTDVRLRVLGTAGALTAGTDYPAIAPGPNPTVSALGDAVAAFGATDEIIIKFNEVMNSSTLNVSNVKLENVTDNQVVVTDRLMGENLTAARAWIALKPGALTTDKVYKITITTNAESYAGQKFARAYEKTFAVSAAPAVAGTTRVSNATKNSAANLTMDAGAVKIYNTVTAPTGNFGALIQVPFSQDLNQSTLTSDNVYLRKSGSTTNIPGTITYAATTRTVQFVPTNDLEESATYVFTMTTGIKTGKGVPLAANNTVTFTTGDFTNPTIVSATPVQNATEVALDAKIIVEFSEPMNDNVTFSTSTTDKYSAGANVSLKDVSGNAYVSLATATKTWSLDGKTLTVTLPAFTRDKTYTFFLRGGDTDNARFRDRSTNLDGSAAYNYLQTEYASTFTTVVTPTAAPTVAAVKTGNHTTAGTAIENGAFNIAKNAQIYVVFNGKMNTGTITANTNFKLQRYNTITSAWTNVTIAGGLEPALIAAANTTSYGYVGINASANNFVEDSKYRLVIT